MTFIITFFVTLFLNVYILIFGKEDINNLRSRLSFGKYLKEIDQALADSMGYMWASLAKFLFIIFLVLSLLFNYLFFIMVFVAVALGTWCAKKLYSVPMVNGFLNKVATYIKRAL